MNYLNFWFRINIVELRSCRECWSESSSSAWAPGHDHIAPAETPTTAQMNEVWQLGRNGPLVSFANRQRRCRLHTSFRRQSGSFHCLFPHIYNIFCYHKNRQNIITYAQYTNMPNKLQPALTYWPLNPKGSSPVEDV